jgi:H+/Cl- antiporter ClcA
MTGNEDVDALEPISKEEKDESRSPKIWMVVLVAVVAIFFTIAWLWVWQNMNTLIWKNSFVLENKWFMPVIVIALSILVGLCVKYLKAPTAMNGSLSESVAGEEEVDWKTFPGTLLTSFFSLLSGASVGPEGPLGFLVREITGFFHEKLKLAKETWAGYSVAGLASAYNGIIGNPLFTALFATEMTEKKNIHFVTWNLLAGIIGFFIFAGLGFQSFFGEIPWTPMGDMLPVYIVYAVIMGVLGALLAIFVAICMKASAKFFGLFNDRVMLRVVIAGIIIAAVSYFLPELMFSGEEQIAHIIDTAAVYGIAMLLLFFVLKIVLFSISFKSGYLGGPIFPILFSCTMLALALSLAFPDVPIIIMVLCIEASAIAMALNAPLTAILLVGVVGATGSMDPMMFGLIVVAVVIAIMIGIGFRKLMQRKTAKPVDSGM